MSLGIVSKVPLVTERTGPFCGFSEGYSGPRKTRKHMKSFYDSRQHVQQNKNVAGELNQNFAVRSLQSDTH